MYPQSKIIAQLESDLTCRCKFDLQGEVERIHESILTEIKLRKKKTPTSYFQEVMSSVWMCVLESVSVVGSNK